MEIHASEIISHLYAIVFIVGFAGYVPQLITLLKTNSGAKSISLITWGVWLTSWLISFLYGVVCLGDLKFCIVAGINIAGHIAVIAVVYHKRRQLALATIH